METHYTVQMQTVLIQPRNLILM